jgi:hypothetical protein
VKNFGRCTFITQGHDSSTLKVEVKGEKGCEALPAGWGTTRPLRLRMTRCARDRPSPCATRYTRSDRWYAARASAASPIAANQRLALVHVVSD